MRKLFLAAGLLLLSSTGLLAQNKTAGNIGIWSNTPAPNSLTDTGAATAPGNFTVTGNLNVLGTTNSVPGIGGGGIAPIENWGVSATATAAENAPKIMNALNESSSTGVTVYLTRIYPTTAITLPAACPSIIGSSIRAGFRFESAVTTGLSITCPVTARNSFAPAAFITLSNFALITTLAGGGQALALTISTTGQDYTALPTAAVDGLLITGDNNCVNIGSCTQAHYWSDGIKCTNCGLAKFQNNYIYGPAIPLGTNDTYPMLDGFWITHNSADANCDAIQFTHNEVWGTHYPIRYTPLGTGRTCEAPYINQNNFIRNDYGVYLEGNNFGPPQSFITANSMECQEPCVWADRREEIKITDNILYNGSGYTGLRDDGVCIRISRTNNFTITNNRCSNIGAANAGTYGGTGIWLGGTSSAARSKYGIVTNNTCFRYMHCVWATEWTQEIYSEMNWMAGPDGRVNTLPSPAVIYQDDTAVQPGAPFNWLGIRCGGGTETGAYGLVAGWNAGLRRTAC